MLEAEWQSISFEKIPSATLSLPPLSLGPSTGGLPPSPAGRPVGDLLSLQSAGGLSSSPLSPSSDLPGAPPSLSPAAAISLDLELLATAAAGFAARSSACSLPLPASSGVARRGGGLRGAAELLLCAAELGDPAAAPEPLTLPRPAQVLVVKYPAFASPNTPPMPDAEKVEAARLVLTRILSNLSRQDRSSSASLPSDLPDLFRRCFLLLPFLNGSDPSLAAECYRGLLVSLGAILSGDLSPSLLPSLEVFVESLVSNGSLRRCLAMADCAAPKGSRIFARDPLCQGDHHLMLELVCRHFISSLEGEGGFEVFWSALSWSGNDSQGTPEISLQGVLEPIHRTCLFLLPTVVQAHLLLLVSRCISDRNVDLHLQAFEHAMNLYVRYLPALHIFNRTGGVKTPWSRFVKKIPLCCCITDATEQKLRNKINGLLSFCQLHSGDDLPINENDIDRLIEEHRHILHEKFRQESSMVVKDILLNILHCAKQKDVHESDTSVSDEIICLAAVLRVMSSSLLHILHSVSQMASAGDKENVNYATLCTGYNFLYESICLLGQHEANELLRYDLIGMPVDRERASIIMLAHFATMSLCCVRKRLGFLWKGCVVMMIMSMNLIAEEEGPGTFEVSSKEYAVVCSTEHGILKVSAQSKAMALRNQGEEEGLGTFELSSKEYPVVCSTEEGILKTKAMALRNQAEEKGLGTFELSSNEYAVVCSTDEGILKDPAKTKAMALRYQALHKIHKGGHVDGDGSRLDTPQKCLSRIGKVDGQAFLECLPGLREKDCNDLKDFVECEEGRDYSYTLKQNRKFRKFKNKKWSRNRQSMLGLAGGGVEPSRPIVQHGWFLT